MHEELHGKSKSQVLYKWMTCSHYYVGLDNLLEVVVHYLLIGRMIGLGLQDEFPMVSALVCMITHWRRLMVSHDISLSSSHNFI